MLHEFSRTEMLIGSEGLNKLRNSKQKKELLKRTKRIKCGDSIIKKGKNFHGSKRIP